MKRNKLATIIAILFFVSAILGFWIVFSQPSQKIERKSKLGISQDKIAVVNILGPIRASMKSSDPFARDSEKIVKRLKKINENASVKAVVLRINSPGGTVAAVQDIYSELLKMKKNGKFVIASFSDVAASGGYYIACAADEIVAQPGTLTGSIGVILEVGNFSELMKKIGVKTETVKSGKHKDIGSFSRDMTPEERKILQGLIDDAYEQFLSAVVTGRKLDEAKARTLADGRIFTGTQAKASGLVDTLGGLDDAIEEAKKLAGIKGDIKIISDSDQWDKIFEFIPAGFEEKAFSKIIPSMNVRFEYILE
ncbi:MAG TPA: signal peptide peptidase SppA [Elusimicrobia bacterium]|nr:signal peptide peptidase SppA [Elusimicrobiota bacterium]